MKVVLLLLVLAAPAAAQEPTPFKWSNHQAVPARISDGLVTAQIVADYVAAARTAEPWHAVRCEAFKSAAVLGTTELLKRVIHRERPNGADDKSFPSMHTALAVAHADYAPAWGASIAVGVGWGRQASGWHFGTDVIAGAGIGFLASRIC